MALREAQLLLLAFDAYKTHKAAVGAWGHGREMGQAIGKTCAIEHLEPAKLSARQHVTRSWTPECEVAPVLC